MCSRKSPTDWKPGIGHDLFDPTAGLEEALLNLQSPMFLSLKRESPLDTLAVEDKRNGSSSTVAAVSPPRQDVCCRPAAKRCEMMGATAAAAASLPPARGKIMKKIRSRVEGVLGEVADQAKGLLLVKCMESEKLCDQIGQATIPQERSVQAELLHLLQTDAR